MNPTSHRFKRRVFQDHTGNAIAMLCRHCGGDHRTKRMSVQDRRLGNDLLDHRQRILDVIHHSIVRVGIVCGITVASKIQDIEVMAEREFG